MDTFQFFELGVCRPIKRPIPTPHPTPVAKKAIFAASDTSGHNTTEKTAANKKNNTDIEIKFLRFDILFNLLLE